MFQFSKINRKIFVKLYHYYCRKLLGQWGMILLMFLASFFLLFNFSFVFRQFDEKTYTWTQYVSMFWLVSLVQMFGVMYVVSNLVARLVGYPTTGLSFRYGRRFGIRRKSNNEDINVLHFTPGVDRQTLIWAKCAALATFFPPINFLFYVLPLAIYLMVGTNLSFGAVASFVLLNGIIFSVANFLWLVPLLFYFYENFNLLLFLILFVLLIVAGISIAVFYKNILEYPLILPLLSLPFSGLFGYFFFRLYWRRYLKKDLV